MLVHPQFSPIAFEVGPLAVHWYGLTYLAAFAQFMWLAARRVRMSPFAEAGWTRQQVEDLLFFGVLGVVLGGRLGYALFYKAGYYAAHPLEVLAVWKGGMSFHGGMLGVLAAVALWARLRGRRFLEVGDLIAPCVPLGLACGRIGNFVNGELWGRAADPALPWAMVFPQSGSGLPRHPSQIYQVLLEGVLLFALLWWYARRPSAYVDGHGRPAWGRVSGAFLVGYGVLRFAAEYFREPDNFLGLLALGLSMGQWLCVPMVIAGAVMWLLPVAREPAAPAVAVKRR